jgi:hypothetical protein
MFDVFYSGQKPNRFAHEQAARDVEHAKELSGTRYFWWINYLTDYSGFDFLFEPVPWQAEYTHAWPSQHHEYSGTYLIPKKGPIKYLFHTEKIQLKSIPENYRNLIPEKEFDFDYSWHPHPLDPPFNYAFGNQWYPANRMPTVEYRVPGATETKYVFNYRAELKSNRNDLNWQELIECEFDYSWCPDPGDPPFIYVFGNQWWPATKMATVEYHVPGATERKYMPFPRAESLIDLNNWEIPEGITDFDYSWRPDPGDPPFNYVFGTQHQATGGPIYRVAGATELKYISLPRARRITVDRDLWTVPENTNRAAFDWTWHPDSRDQPYQYQFATQWNRAGGPVYTVPGATEIKYISHPVARMLPTDRNWSIPDNIDPNSFDFSWTPDATEQPFVYEFGTQWQKTGGPKYCVPGATVTKYVNEPRAVKTIKDDCWIVPQGADVESFDWTWHPDSTEQPYIYQFGTQHQRTGGPQYHVTGATETKYIDQIRIRTERVATAIYEINHLDGNAGQIKDTIKSVRYFDNYLDTLRRIAASVPDEHEFVWICSSICDYTDFDFTWHPEQWQAAMLHVFPSDGMKFGDTFFMHVPTFRYRADKCQLLDWYDVNYMDINVPRRPLPIIQHTNDTQVTAIKNNDFMGPLAIFTTVEIDKGFQPPAVPLWREKTKTIVPLSAGASTVIIPKVAVPYIKRQLYDYPNIDRTQRHMLTDELLDIVFIDNGEPNAEENYQHLKWAAERANNIKIHRSSGVNGRVAAYQAAAELSTTPWFFAVFAKLRVNSEFNWAWQPDRLQEPKHYIFNAFNPVNGLTYGHQAMIAYNKELVLGNTGVGLDFTLDSAHEVVPLLSGTAEYAHTKWSAWRTAFREVLKLKGSDDVESRYRLDKWLTVDLSHSNGQYSIYGAEDAVEYYDTVAGDFIELKKSYDWAWLASYALIKRNLIAD